MVKCGEHRRKIIQKKGNKKKKRIRKREREPNKYYIFKTF